ncbi:MAG: hypothetical protein ACKO4U_17955, partial [Caldilinea sp.]
LSPSGAGRQAILAEVRPALIELRDAYRSRVEPRYSDLWVRRAYGLAYMPMYVASLEALYRRSSVWDHLARKRSITIGSLGTGPGTEVLAFALAMRSRKSTTAASGEGCGAFPLPVCGENS